MAYTTVELGNLDCACALEVGRVGVLGEEAPEAGPDFVDRYATAIHVDVVVGGDQMISPACLVSSFWIHMESISKQIAFSTPPLLSSGTALTRAVM